VTALLTGAAVVATIVLLLSAARTGGAATPSDRNSRGPWGIVTRAPSGRRPLNPHERRWQTSLLSGRKNASRWKDLVVELRELERRAGCDLGEAPDEYDGRWIDESIRALERSIRSTEHREGANP